MSFCDGMAGRAAIVYTDRVLLHRWRAEIVNVRSAKRQREALRLYFL